MKAAISLFAPASVANISCGYDVLGLCLESVGDTMHFEKNSSGKVVLHQIDGTDLPLEPTKNVAGVAALAYLKAQGITEGCTISIKKGILPGSGIGSSAASAVGAVVGVNALFGSPLSRAALLPYALEGEAIASKARHADNIAPALLGGICLVRSTTPLETLALPCPKDLHIVVIHPQIEVKTAAARALIGNHVPLPKTIQQAANLGAFVHALHTEDYSLMGRAVEDHIAEPHRKQLIPHFDTLKAAALEAGATACGISGAGPSVFALAQGNSKAQAVVDAFDKVYQTTTIQYTLHSSKINPEGVRLLY